MPVHKKEDKNLLKKNTGLLLYCRFFLKCQSGFLPGDYCILQLLSIVHDINSSIGCDLTIDVSGVFLDISKLFDKILHDEILPKMETYGAKGKLLILI